MARFKIATVDGYEVMVEHPSERLRTSPPP
jgi:hypothetical protein